VTVGSGTVSDDEQRAIATGLGSWPGTDVAEALRVVAGELPDLPHLPELPGRGPGADLIGRAAARLVDLPVDLQPSGWRLVDHAGRDQARAAAFWREDLDRMAHTFDGWQGPLKVQQAGPFTLAAALWLPRGDRAVSDPGARRDLIASSAAAVDELVRDVIRLVPGAEVVLQLDEPSLPAVLGGRLRSASGFGVLRAIEPAEARDGLTAVLDSAKAAGATTAVHCCGDGVPLGLLHQAGADALSLDIGLLGHESWDALAEAVESGTRLWAGVLPTSGELPTAADVSADLARRWRDVGLSPELLRNVVVTPTCGLAGRDPAGARETLVRCVEAAKALTEASVD
jgi:methionine synthase II (cobalamin-independent)